MPSPIPKGKPSAADRVTLLGPRNSFGIAIVTLWIAGLAPAAVAEVNQLNERVLVVYNSSASESLAVATHYMTLRKIPEAHRCKISLKILDVIPEEEFETGVKRPVQKCLNQVGKQKILYIVFSYQTPYAVRFKDRIFSLDQQIADIWDEHSSTDAVTPTIPQPYFSDAQSQGNVYSPFTPTATYRDSPGAKNIYSVWRLDAANANLAKGLVDKALAIEKDRLAGVACFDRQFGKIDGLPDTGGASGDWDIHQSADFAKEAGFRVIEDESPVEFGTAPAPARCDNAALYAGWYSLNHYNDAFTWEPGAIGFHLDSASAMNPRGGENWSANALLKGITVTSGAVSEPYLAGLAHPDQIFLDLFRGANVGDAVFRSTRWIKWTILNIGDPLYRPFPQGIPPFNSSDRDKPLLALLPQIVVGGDTSTVVFHTTTPAPRGGTPVIFQSDHADLITVPEIIRIPEKGNTARFPIISRSVTSETIIHISVSALGSSRSNTLVIYPPSGPR